MYFYARSSAVEPSGWPGIVPLVEVLLRQRGIETAEQAEGFLSPSLARMPDLHVMPGLLPAAERIRWAVRSGQSIVVYGDYDADGVTATAILIQALRVMGAAKVRPYIPSREAMGYGLNAQAVRELAPETDLIITTDLGITALDEVRLCNELGLDVVVTDHHHPLDTLPETPWIVHPLLEKNSPFAPMCGAGVAWVLASALAGEGTMRATLDLAALGTVADLVPLTGVNRILVVEGLRGMNEKLRPGLEALAREAGTLEKPVGAGMLGFIFGPRINAGGRLSENTETVHMLLASEASAAKEQAKRLCELNQQRIDAERLITDEAVARIEQDGIARRSIILEGDWHPGIVGIVASRLVERYHVPVVLLCANGELLTGSARSVVGVHLFRVLEELSSLFIRFGGHAMAAGMTLPAKNLDAFRTGFQEKIDAFDPDLFLPKTPYDAALDIDSIDLELAEQIEKMQPFGMGHPAPVFYSKGVRLESVRTIGASGEHLKSRIGSLQVVAFRMANRKREMEEPLDIAYTIDRNEWNQHVSVQINLREIARAIILGEEDEGKEREAALSFLQTIYQCMHDGEGSAARAYLSEEEAYEWIARRAHDPQGILLLCAQLKTRDKLHGWLEGLGAAHRFTIANGAPPNHPRALGTLVVAPWLKEPAFARYHTVLWCDGLWDDGLSWALSAHAAEQYVCDTPGWRSDRAALAAKALPDTDDMRAMWRWLRDHPREIARCTNLAELIRAMSPLAVDYALQTGLLALRSAGYASFSLEGPLDFQTSEGTGNPAEQGYCNLLREWRDGGRATRSFIGEHG